ncbi:hypothetical protein IFM89_026771 [Coptis chinensis]|uniref:Uncharacterized protein n=1 Tax=Coptis chinensis TaxID=261450 RepID=A0A835IHL4_9MAGN|nr:hypothetical protein IFM89_026771 [Coptis chinensis]
MKDMNMEQFFGTSLGVYSTLIFLILLGRAVLVILGSAISSVFNKMYGFSRITYKDQVIIWWAGLMRRAISIALAFSQYTHSDVPWDSVQATIVIDTIIVVLLLHWCRLFVEEGSRSYGVMGIPSLVGVVSFVVFFSLGIGAIPWVIMSEVCSLYRTSDFSNFNGSLSKSTKNMGAHLGGTFTIYTVVSAFTVVFVAMWVPETKGRTLEEI